MIQWLSWLFIVTVGMSTIDSVQALTDHDRGQRGDKVTAIQPTEAVSIKSVTTQKTAAVEDLVHKYRRKVLSLGKTMALKKGQLCLMLHIPAVEELFPKIAEIKKKGIGSYLASSQVTFIGPTDSRQGASDKVTLQLTKLSTQLEKEILAFDKQIRQLSKSDAQIILNNAQVERQSVLDKLQTEVERQRTLIDSQQVISQKIPKKQQKRRGRWYTSYNTPRLQQKKETVSLAETLSFTLQIEDDLIATAYEVVHHDEIAAENRKQIQRQFGVLMQQREVMMKAASNTPQDAADLVAQGLLQRGTISSQNFTGYAEKGSGMPLSENQIRNKPEIDVVYSVQYATKSGLVRQGLLLVGLMKGMGGESNKQVVWKPQVAYIDNNPINLNLILND